MQSTGSLYLKAVFDFSLKLFGLDIGLYLIGQIMVDVHATKDGQGWAEGLNALLTGATHNLGDVTPRTWEPS